MHFIRRSMIIGARIALASAISGCVVRPLWWGGHDSHAHERGGRSDPHHGRRNLREEHRNTWSERR